MTGERLVPALLWGLVVLFVAAIVHIASILVLPRVAPNDAFSRVAAASPAGAIQLLPKAASRQNAVPFRDPAVASAICRYDLEQGPMRVSAAVSDLAFLTVSFHSRYGLPFYALNDRASNGGKIELVLLSPAQLEKAEAGDSEDDPVRDVRVAAPTAQGFVEFDSLARIGGYPAAEQALRSVGCTIQRSF